MKIVLIYIVSQREKQNNGLSEIPDNKIYDRDSRPGNPTAVSQTLSLNITNSLSANILPAVQFSGKESLSLKLGIL